ncbi:hypothetical protein BAE44_0000904 [Dichanthelium oligosanthes]|uniref:Uncharacterized protein n=1 Tax=Dichanthelium oligosanthes TaxID=888268 RepID=A0A1E5WL13_9POAL|nr:hypothetical protein BAE44_0000904 [Dichanthelium oligosanthes]
MDGGEHEVEESSSQRRERLLALRSAANVSPAEAPPPAPAGSLLPDPDLAGDQASCPRPRPPQRFDFYTNPAAAFSSSYSGGPTNPTWSHKRKSPPACYDPRPAPPPPAYAEPRNYGTYYPPHQHHMTPAPIHYPSPMQPGVPGSSLWQRPMQFQTPMPGYQGNPFGAPPHWGPHFASPARCSYPNSPSFGFRHTNPSQWSSHITYGPRGNYGNNYPPHEHHSAPSPIHSPPLMPRDPPGSSPWRSPMQFQDLMSGYQGAPPGAPPPWGPHSGTPARGSYPNSPRFGFRHPNPGRGGSPMNYGPRGSPYSSYGRGRGLNYYGSPGSRGRGGRGGFGFQNDGGWQHRSYFNKSMVDDPWLGLQPVVGNILIPRARGDFESWLPESLRVKKETPAQGHIKSTSGLSLAEYLDLSFNEVSNKET